MKLTDIVKTIPEYLYHGSGYEQDELKPGYSHSKELTTWDKYENNTYLYATTIRDSAIALGFSSAIEKKYDLESTHISEKTKTIKLVFRQNIPDIKDIENIKVYLYTLKYDPNIWTKNNNPFNNIDNEYKTKKEIKDIVSRNMVDIPELLKQYQLSMSGV